MHAALTTRNKMKHRCNKRYLVSVEISEVSILGVQIGINHGQNLIFPDPKYSISSAVR